MNHTKKKSKKQGKNQLPLFLLSAGAVLVLLLMILLLGGRASAPAPGTDSTFPLPEANPYDADDFSYDGAYLTCRTAGSMLGVDVSEHQPSVDWEQVRQSGVEYAMIRIGYRGYTEGRIFPDASFSEHLTGAKEAGLKVGVYFFSQAVTVREAQEEAAFLLEHLDGAQLDMPVVFDWEYVSQDARTGNMDGETLTDCAVAFCDAVQAAGYCPMVYFNLDISQNLYDLRALTDYDFWLAMYSDRMDYPYKIKMWQYTDSGSVPGIDGSVDLNLYLP